MKNIRHSKESQIRQSVHRRRRFIRIIHQRRENWKPSARPLYTRFDRRNFYVTYDVTNQLQKGKNAIGVLLGNGWYNHQSKAVWDFDRAPCVTAPLFAWT